MLLLFRQCCFRLTDLRDGDDEWLSLIFGLPSTIGIEAAGMMYQYVRYVRISTNDGICYVKSCLAQSSVFCTTRRQISRSKTDLDTRNKETPADRNLRAHGSSACALKNGDSMLGAKTKTASNDEQILHKVFLELLDPILNARCMP